MKNKLICIFYILFLSSLGTMESALSKETKTSILRLTYSGNDKVFFPCLSDDGNTMIYTLETQKEGKSIRALRVIDIAQAKERELFVEDRLQALPPFEEASLKIGSKPPVLSGDGKIAILSLSIGAPYHILDHYLAVLKTDGTQLKLISFPIKALSEMKFEKLGFKSDSWERISTYALDHEGKRIALVLKGHLGPRRYGNASCLLFLDLAEERQRTILAPDFKEKEWVWSSFPRNPLTGGGWSFAISGNGELVIFGAQASEVENDYDLFLTDWEGQSLKRITDFHDRWFTQAEMSFDGKSIIFFYNGNKKEGMGTYLINSDDEGLRLLESKISSQIEFFDFSGNGKRLIFKHIYRGVMLDLGSGKETIIFDEEASPDEKRISLLDFPQVPSFWTPKVLDFKGKKLILSGIPAGRNTPEFYLLSLQE